MIRGDLSSGGLHYPVNIVDLVDIVDIVDICPLKNEQIFSGGGAFKNIFGIV